MKTVFGILLLAIIALAGHRRSFVRIPFLRTGPSFFLTGIEFLLVGYVLSDSFLGILDSETLDSLRPFLILGLGWVGLITGLQLEWNALRLFPRSSYAWVLIHAVFVSAAVSIGLYFLIGPWFPASSDRTFSIALLSIAALCSAQTSLALWTQRGTAQKRAVGKILQFASSLNDVGAILLFGLLLAFHGLPGDWEGISVLPWERLLFSLLLGVLMGILFLALFRTRLAEAEKALVVIGLVLFGGGMAYLLRISPLLIFLIVGILLANASVKGGDTLSFLLKIEKPLYLIFILFAGAYLRIDSPRVIGIALLYTTLRALSHRVAGGLFLGRVFRTSIESTRFLGWGLLSQAGIAVALAVHFRLWMPDDASFPMVRIAYSALLLAILCNELLSPLGLSVLSKRK